MSEFTAGNLVLNEHAAEAEQATKGRLKKLNEQWSVLFTEETEVTDCYPHDALVLSERLPVLYFYHFEDHGWGFHILSEGRALADFHYGYEALEIALQTLAQQRFPDRDPFEALYIDSDSEEVRTQLLEELKQTKEFRPHSGHPDPEAFRLFGFEEHTVDSLKTLLDDRSLAQTEISRALVETFKTLLNLEEMSWIRPDRD